MKYGSLLVLLILTGCAAVPSEHHTQESPSLPEPPPSAEILFAPPPQLWSAHKALKESPEACAEKAVQTLKALRFISVAKNGTYVYGTLLANRATIKCVPNGEGTFVYTVVAGPEKDQVGRLRNEIFWRL